MDELYHVRTSENPSDIGTRPDRVTIHDVGPDSIWENGCVWMHGSLDEAVENGTLVPAQNLRLNKDEMEEFSKGLVFDSSIPEILTKGHIANQNRISLIEERAQFSQYLILPTKFAFQRTVRIYGYIMMFLVKCKRKCGVKQFSGPLLREGESKFSMFSCIEVGPIFNSFHLVTPDYNEISKGQQNCLVDAFTFDLSDLHASSFRAMHSEIDGNILVTDKYLSIALMYLFRKATAEIQEFCSNKVIEKHMIMKDGILLSKNRLLDCLDFTYTGEISVDLR